MGEQVKCPCGACKFWPRVGDYHASWSMPHNSYVALECTEGFEMGFCPLCGARLSFDEQGGPVVEARLTQADIDAAVAAERGRHSILVMVCRRLVREYRDLSRSHGCLYRDVQDALAILDAPDPPQEADHA